MNEYMIFTLIYVSSRVCDLSQCRNDLLQPKRFTYMNVHTHEKYLRDNSSHYSKRYIILNDYWLIRDSI